MPDTNPYGFATRDPQVYKTAIIGTAVGTTTISSVPIFLKDFQVTHRTASATFIFYESIGTSTSVLGTLVLGTATTEDPPPPFKWDRSCSALSVAHTTTNSGGIVRFNTP